MALARLARLKQARWATALPVIGGVTASPAGNQLEYVAALARPLTR